MNVIYGIYADPETAQRAVNALHKISEVLEFDTEKIVIVSGEPHEGYEFTDAHITKRPYRWAAIGGIIGGLCGYLLTTLTQKSYPIFTGGMPLTPAWTNGIIIYELTMLGAILTTLVVLLRGSNLPNFKGVIQDPEIWNGKILVGIADPPDNVRPALEMCLIDSGAPKVKEASTPR